MKIKEKRFSNRNTETRGSIGNLACALWLCIEALRSYSNQSKCPPARTPARRRRTYATGDFRHCAAKKRETKNKPEARWRSAPAPAKSSQRDSAAARPDNQTFCTDVPPTAASAAAEKSQ